MIIPCPNCASQVELRSAPVRGNAGDGSDAWVCLYCAQIVCVDCYHGHVQQRHPDRAGEIKKPKKK